MHITNVHISHDMNCAVTRRLRLICSPQFISLLQQCVCRFFHVAMWLDPEAVRIIEVWIPTIIIPTRKLIAASVTIFRKFQEPKLSIMFLF